MTDDVLKVGPDLTNGPEFEPLKIYNTQWPSHVFVLDIKDDNTIIAHGQFDYAKSDHRKWLGKITFWAMSKGYAVETVAAKDVEPEWKE